MIVFDNGTFRIDWNVWTQEYTVYKDGKFFITAYRFRDVECYTRQNVSLWQKIKAFIKGN